MCKIRKPDMCMSLDDSNICLYDTYAMQISEYILLHFSCQKMPTSQQRFDIRTYFYSFGFNFMKGCFVIRLEPFLPTNIYITCSSIVPVISDGIICI